MHENFAEVFTRVKSEEGAGVTEAQRPPPRSGLSSRRRGISYSFFTFYNNATNNAGVGSSREHTTALLRCFTQPTHSTP